MKKCALLLCLLSAQCLAGWKWYEWPTKEVVFFEVGAPAQATPGRWSVKTPAVTVTYSEYGISVVITRPRVNTKTKEHQEIIDRTCETLFTNVFPYWDGAYESMIQLWEHYEQDKKPLPIAFNQFKIEYTSNERQRTVTISPREEFSFNKRRKEIARRRSG